MQKAGEKNVSGKAVFTLYDTFGFPDDLTEIVAGERGFGVDKLGFDEEMAKAKERSRFSGSDQEAVATEIKARGERGRRDEVPGYEGRGVSGEGSLKAILRRRRARPARVDRREGRARVRPDAVLRRSRRPDRRHRLGHDEDARRSAIDDTKKPAGDVHVLMGEVTLGAIGVGEHVHFEVDDERRERIRANHSATHLLNHALQHGARRPRRAEGLARRARPPALRLRALLADDATSRCARSRTS